MDRFAVAIGQVGLEAGRAHARVFLNKDNGIKPSYQRRNTVQNGFGFPLVIVQSAHNKAAHFATKMDHNQQVEAKTPLMAPGRKTL